MLKPRDCIVVGGGAAGMLAAIVAAEAGERVTLLEGSGKLGRKILISGNGRCNLTNKAADDLRHYHGTHPRFVRSALEQFRLDETLAFFADLGIEFREEKRQRLFPVSDQAQSVVDLLADRMRCLGVRVETNAKVVGMSRASNSSHFELRDAEGQCYTGARVILASGGVSLARLGADRSGMDLAVGLGHRLTDLKPGLVPLISPEKYVARMQGLKVRAEVRVTLKGGREAVDTDDLLFTKYGVSGFTILNLSARLVPELGAQRAMLRVNFFPGRSPEAIGQLLKERWQRHPHRSLELSFAGLLSSKLVRPLLNHLGFDAAQRVDQFGKGARWQLAQSLTNWPIAVSGPRPFDYAEVTIGGVRTEDINPDTLESFLVPGLYFAGEMVDIHADLGGFNFQWAWASGVLAGRRLGS
ncbi:MAG: NAD(P)/FAD-dependent oxidoreductase [Gemmatimonadetes bacterium]|nr:NAD(P)/FAD-dependent oxidoreductase [Gemmatimonadota bacterium]